MTVMALPAMVSASPQMGCVLGNRVSGWIRESLIQRSRGMKRARIGMFAIATLAVATMAFAQAKPDFSGTWTPDQPAGAPGGGGAPGGAPGGGGGGGGRGMAGPMTVKQSATELTVERQGRNGAQTTTYKLDGSESKIQMGQMEATATAKWDGSKLVITTKTDQVEQAQTWSLASGVLTIDRTGGRGPSTTTYKKST